VQVVEEAGPRKARSPFGVSRSEGARVIGHRQIDARRISGSNPDATAAALRRHRHRCAQRADVIQRPRQRNHAAICHATVGWFQTDDSAVRGRDANRPRGVGAKPAETQVRGNGSGRTAGRSSRHAIAGTLKMGAPSAASPTISSRSEELLFSALASHDPATLELHRKGTRASSR
jgi:hypothetical protein